jgi:hypothetical protein
MPEDTFSHTAIVNAAIGVVWARLQHADTWKGVARIDRVWGAEHSARGDLEAFSWGAVAAGREWEGSAAVTASNSPGYMAVLLDSEEIVGEVTVELDAAAGDGSTGITVTLTARSKGLLSGMFWPAVKDTLASGLRRQLDQFASGGG